MNKENTFKVIDREGKEIEFEILFTFESDETKKNYMVYTDNTKDEEGNTKVYASVFKPDAEPLELLPVETEREWKIIETIITSITEESKKETLPPQEESISLPEDTKALEDPPKEETLSSTPGEASIYDSKYTNLVNQDKLTHPRDEVLTMDIPEEPINELAVTFDKELDNSVKEDSSKVKEEPKEGPKRNCKSINSVKIITI